MEAAKTNSNPVETKLHFLDYWRIIRIRKTVILAVFLLVVLTTTAVTFILPESWSSTVRIAVEKDVSDINPIGFAQNNSAYDPFFIQTEFEKIRSRKVLYKVIENLKLNERWGGRYNNNIPLKTPETFDILQGKIDVRQTRNTSLIEIRVYSDAKEKEKPAQEAAEIANEIANVYRDTRLELKQEMSRKGIQVLREELQQNEEKVKAAEAEVDQLGKEYKVSNGSLEGATLEPQTVRSLEEQRIRVEAEFSGLAGLLNGLLKLREEKGNTELRKSILTAINDELLSKLMMDLSTTEANLAKLKETLGPENSDFKAMAAVQANLDTNINQRIEGMLAGLKLKVDAFRLHLDSLAGAVDHARTNDAFMTEQYRPYFKAKRRLDDLTKLRDAVHLRILQETVDAALPKTSIVEITDQAEPGRKPVSPSFKLNIALGIIVGLIVGISLAFFIEYLDTSVKTIDDVERALQAPVLGVIPQNVSSLILEGSESPHAEAYRVLRTNVLFSRKREDANSLTVVSGGAGEGKSTTIFNLAVVFAQNGQRALLVDSDLRRPSLHKLLNVSNSVGLTSYLLRQNTLEEVIQTTSIPTLDFLPSGKLPSSSLGILNSAQMKDFIKEAKRRYDFVFFDSPPIMGVSDASILASEVDLSLLVIQYRKYPQAMTIRAKQMVEKVGGALLGVVLNNINISQDSYYYYYSGYYYDYYAKREEEPPAKNNGEKKTPAGERAQLDLKQKY
ncbi:MAG: capsular biosynthesis protein [Verrucomicrobia bacterium]|nr:MAG: capsular biosynthesis protein [Verrucomicrobiota bacterium]